MVLWNCHEGCNISTTTGCRVCGPEVIKKSSSSTQLSMKISQLINVKMSIVVSILKFMNRKNSILGLSKPEKN